MTATIPSALLTARESVDARLRQAIDQLDPDTKRVSEYHLGWVDANGAARAGSGKAVRPAMVLLSAQAGGGASDHALSVAAAVELVHNFSLLHDDLMDGDLARRHRPTAWTVFGKSRALLAGDALLGLATETVLADRSPFAPRAARELSRTVRSLIAGQSADLDFESRSDVGLDECLRMVEGKTAALLACASSIGALRVGAPQRTVDRLHAFGYELGIAFQLVDDLLGLWGDPDETGKPVLSDLRARKKSVPVVHALNSGTDSGRQLAALYARSDPLSENELEYAADLVRLAGSEEWTRAETERRLASGTRYLQEIESNPATDAFAELADFILRRNQ